MFCYKTVALFLTKNTKKYKNHHKTDKKPSIQRPITAVLFNKKAGNCKKQTPAFHMWKE